MMDLGSTNKFNGLVALAKFVKARELLSLIPLPSR